MLTFDISILQDSLRLYFGFAFNELLFALFNDFKVRLFLITSSYKCGLFRCELDYTDFPTENSVRKDSAPGKKRKHASDEEKDPFFEILPNESFVDAIPNVNFVFVSFTTYEIPHIPFHTFRSPILISVKSMLSSFQIGIA